MNIVIRENICIFEIISIFFLVLVGVSRCLSYIEFCLVSGICIFMRLKSEIQG